MNPKPNIGIVNAMIRITCGLTTLAMATSKMTRQPGSFSHMLLAVMGAMKVAEGIVRYCPVTAAMQSGMNFYDDMMDSIVDDKAFDGFGTQNDSDGKNS